MNPAEPAASSSSTPEENATQVKRIDVAVQLEQTVALVVTLGPVDQERTTVRAQVHPTQGVAYLPPHLELSLCASNEVLQTVEAMDQDRYIQLGFRCPAGTAFTLRVTRGEWMIEEDFVV